MSSALLRQSLELVDSEVGRGRKRNKKTDIIKPSIQVQRAPYKKAKKIHRIDNTPSDKKIEENLRKLQALSTPTLDQKITDKIVERAVKGRALADKIEIVKEEDRPVLFTEETFKQFEKELFCS